MANNIYHKSNWGSPEKDDWGDVYFNPSATNKLYTRSDNYENEDGTDKALASKPDTQSVLMTPTAYSVGSMNSILPTNGDGNFTFDRNSTATRVNKEGLIETVAIDTPRLDYPFIDGVVQDCPALLLEPARTNLFLNSNLFTAWSKEATVTLTANYGISPDGTQNSTRMQMSENDSIYSSTTSGLTASVYVKGVQGETIRLSNGSTVIHTLTGQWDRIEVYDSGSVSTLITINTYLGATARDIELFGAQREAGSYATSYIPTSGSSVTRAAETANGAGTSDDFNSSEGVLYAETAALADDGTSRTISINNTVSNRVFLQLRATSGQVLSGVVKGGVVQGTVMSYSISQTSNIKFLIKYKVNDFALWVNGFEVGTSTGNVFSSGILNDLSFDSGDGAEDFYGKTKEVGVFKTALTDSELEALTSWDSFSDMATGQEYTIR